MWPLLFFFFGAQKQIHPPTRQFPVRRNLRNASERASARCLSGPRAKTLKRNETEAAQGIARYKQLWPQQHRSRRVHTHTRCRLRKESRTTTASVCECARVRARTHAPRFAAASSETGVYTVQRHQQQQLCCGLPAIKTARAALSVHCHTTSYEDVQQQQQRHLKRFFSHCARSIRVLSARGRGLQFCLFTTRYW